MKGGSGEFGPPYSLSDRCLILHRIARNIRLSGFN
ncbi:hypothetical protein DM56_4770 [Burkholderia mallei]|nr:hypothetical protein DM56_4770 [Burkholderia mallei]KOT10876.1 hypothetical protein DM77_3419 [Burkholderia mallei]